MMKMQIVLMLIVSCLTAVSAKPPHIIFIVADDLGFNDVGWRNKDMLTPNLDKLASEGVILNSSYVQPVCSPSRNAFMTGYYPYHTGLQHSVIHPALPYGLPLKFTVLPQRLKQAGYRAHIVGKWHLGFCKWEYTPTYRGFDSFYGYYTGAEDYFTHIRDDGLDLRDNKVPDKSQGGKYSANLFAEKAIEIINNHNMSEPLYLYLPYQSVHAPLEVPEHYLKPYEHIQTKNRRLYSGMVSALDEAIGNVTAVLKQKGILDDAVLFFTTDNGGPSYLGANNWPLRGAKTTLWEGGTRGSGFVWSKMLKKTQYINNQMIHAVDWFPTILNLAGLPPEKGIDGMDQWASISEDMPTKRNEFVYNIDELIPDAAIRMGDYKLIVGSAGRYNGWYPPPKSDADEPAWVPDDIADNLARFQDEEIQLFNIKDDPTEHHNIASKYPDIVDKMKERLAEYRKSLYPAYHPKDDPASDPKHWGGVWSPGWC